MSKVSDTQIGEIVVSHHHSLPFWEDAAGRRWSWPWVLLFYGVPAAVAAFLTWYGLTSFGGGVTALLAGVGVLTGFLFQVLAWTGARIATLADSVAGRHPSPDEISLLGRLDVARSNIAYATLLSVVFVAELGLLAMLDHWPEWINSINVFILIHLSLTLVLVVLRINMVGRDDRINTLIARTRLPPTQRSPHAESGDHQ